MSWNACRGRGLPSLLALATLVAMGQAEARAQWGYGGGWGWGMGLGGFNYVPQPTDFLNQKALINAAQARGPVSNNPYATSANAYYNSVRDSGFVPHYDVQRRPTPSRSTTRSSLGHNAAPSAEDQPSVAEPRPKPSLPLASFFDKSMHLVWTADAPLVGDLKEKRDLSDKATQAVLEEILKSGVGSISSVAEARKKLLDYGRPALEIIRARSTPRIADTFHFFLLSLYESLTQAATTAHDNQSGPS